MKWLRDEEARTPGWLQRGLALLQATQHQLQKKAVRSRECTHRRWMRKRGIFDPGRLVFIDETCTNTRMVRLYARCPRGMFTPLEGWRHVKVTERRTAIHYANVLKDLSDVHFPGAETIVLVQDNLNTPHAESLYEAFPAPEAHRLVEHFDGTTPRNTQLA